MFKMVYVGRVNSITDVRILLDACLRDVIFEETISFKDGINVVKDCVFVQSSDSEWDDGRVWQRAGQDVEDQNFQIYIALEADLIKKTLELQHGNECYRISEYCTSQLRPYSSPSTDHRLLEKVYERSIFLWLLTNRAEVDKRLSDIESDLPKIEDIGEAIHLEICKLNQFTTQLTSDATDWIVRNHEERQGFQKHVNALWQLEALTQRLVRVVNSTDCFKAIQGWLSELLDDCKRKNRAEIPGLWKLSAEYGKQEHETERLSELREKELGLAMDNHHIH